MRVCSLTLIFFLHGVLCQQCPLNARYVSAYSVCLCNNGYYGNVGGQCTSCPANSGANCVTSGTSYCEVQDGCSCNPGYTGPSGGTCGPCAPGTYKNQFGSRSYKLCPAGTYFTSTGASALSTCVSCPIDTYSEATGASALTTCVACPAGKTSSLGSVVCRCALGSYLPDQNTRRVHPVGPAPPRRGRTVSTAARVT